MSDPNASTPGEEAAAGEPGRAPWLISRPEPTPSSVTASSEDAQPAATAELPPVPASASPYPTEHQPTASPPAYPAQAYPAGAYPTGAAPVSATPYSAAPYSAAPYSAAPYSAAPYSVAPFPPQQPAKRNRWGIVLGSLALVLLLAAGAVTTLYVIERAEAAKESTDQRVQIVALADQLEGTEDELTATKAELRKTQVDLTDAEEDLAKVEEGCPKAVQEFFDAAKQAALSGRSNSPEATAAANRMVVACGVSL